MKLIQVLINSVNCSVPGSPESVKGDATRPVDRGFSINSINRLHTLSTQSANQPNQAVFTPYQLALAEGPEGNCRGSRRPLYGQSPQRLPFIKRKGRFCLTEVAYAFPTNWPLLKAQKSRTVIS